MTLAAVTGLEAEDRIVRAIGIPALATGADAARAAAIAEQLLAGGASALLSFGIAGALKPGLASGTILLPRRVRSEAGDAFAADAAWHARVRAALGARGIAAIEDDLFGATQLVAARAAKTDLHRRTGAAAVDLESAIAAAAARRFGRPFLAVRAIADPADFALPPAALVGIDAAGRTALGPVLRSILRRPGQLAALVRLALHTRRALAALAHAAPALRDLSAPPGRR
jgi:adenosylhomocysteine nucleosidase